MTKPTYVHWLFKEEPTLEAHHLCDFPASAMQAEHSIVLRPIIRQRPGSPLRECPRCAKIGKDLSTP